MASFRRLNGCRQLYACALQSIDHDAPQTDWKSTGDISRRGRLYRISDNRTPCSSCEAEQTTRCTNLSTMRQAYDQTCCEEGHEFRKRILELFCISRMQRNKKYLLMAISMYRCVDITAYRTPTFQSLIITSLIDSKWWPKRRNNMRISKICKILLLFLTLTISVFAKAATLIDGSGRPTNANFLKILNFRYIIRYMIKVLRTFAARITFRISICKTI